MAENPDQRELPAPSLGLRAPRRPTSFRTAGSRLIQGMLAVVMLVGLLAIVHYCGPMTAKGMPPDDPPPTGGSGGPVFHARDEVIGVNSAYMEGFWGGTLGVSVESLRPLLEPAQVQRCFCGNPIPAVCSPKRSDSSNTA